MRGQPPAWRIRCWCAGHGSGAPPAGGARATSVGGHLPGSAAGLAHPRWSRDGRPQGSGSTATAGHHSTELLMAADLFPPPAPLHPAAVSGGGLAMRVPIAVSGSSMGAQC
jgi:hypothetical protein